MIPHRQGQSEGGEERRKRILELLLRTSDILNMDSCGSVTPRARARSSISGNAEPWSGHTCSRASALKMKIAGNARARVTAVTCTGTSNQHWRVCTTHHHQTPKTQQPPSNMAQFTAVVHVMYAWRHGKNPSWRVGTQEDIPLPNDA